MISQVARLSVPMAKRKASRQRWFALLSHSPHSRLFHNVHIFCWSLFCMIKLTMFHKLDHNSASHMLASISFIPLLVLNSCGIINLGWSCLSCWKVWYNKIEVFLSFLIEHRLEKFYFEKKIKTLSLTNPQWFKIPTTTKILIMIKPIHLPPI